MGYEGNNTNKLQDRSSTSYMHLGIIRIKLLSRSYVRWPRPDSNIENLVHSSTECAAFHSLPPKAPLHSLPWANHPMQRLHIDYANIEGH